jgi:hypothetical protein
MNRNPFILREFQKKVKELTDENNISKIKKKSREISSFKDKLNVFEMIGLGRQEIRHSYFLRWLCGDNEHYFGHRIFISFLSSLYPDLKKDLSKKDLSFNIPLKEFTFQYDNKRRYLDFFAIDETNKRLFVIEVKIDASEHDDQLTHYYDYFTNEDRYSGFDKRFIFLTIDGRKPKEDIDKERWISVDYNNIQKSIESVLAKKITDLSLKLALKDYIILLKKHEKMAEKKDELKLLSKEIWAEHRDVLEILLQHKPKRNGGLLQLLRDKNYTDVDLTVDYNKKSYEITLKKDGLLWYGNKSYENTKKLHKGLFYEEKGYKSTSGTSTTYDKVKWLKLDGEHLGQKYLDSESDYKDIEKAIDDLQKEDAKYNRLTF